MDCDICCETINKSSHKRILCPTPSCSENVCCMKCFIHLMNDCKDDLMSCVFCKKTFSNVYVASQVSKSFYRNVYMKHRGKLELEKEKLVLPLYQKAAEIAMKEKILLGKKKTLIEYADYYIEKQKLGISSPMDIIYVGYELPNIKRKIYIITSKLDLLKLNERLKPDKPTRAKFVFRCSYEDCRGFLSDSWKCGLCEKQTCRSCHKEKMDKTHECDENDIETVKMIKSECKSCPKCKIPIYKSYGCDLMWCVQCHVNFSWNTGMIIVTKHNHNPHYYEWQRATNGTVERAPGDVQYECGTLPWISVIELIMIEKYETFPDLENCHRLIGEMTTPMQPIVQTDIIKEKLRIKYLINDITEQQWIHELTLLTRKNEMINEKYQLHILTSTIMVDTFVRYVNGIVLDLYKEMHSIRDYVNRKHYDISSLYGSAHFIITKQWKTIGSQ
jgi:hypothetical protein